MQTYARIDGGIVAEIITIDSDGPSLADRFHPDLVAAMVLVPAGSDVTTGWTWGGAFFSPPPAAPSPTAADLRRRRNGLIAASDWTQLPDAPLSAEARAAWADYRQALRDVPEQPGWPEEVTWPVEPGA